MLIILTDLHNVCNVCFYNIRQAVWMHLNFFFPFLLGCGKFLLFLCNSDVNCLVYFWFLVS